MFSSNTDVRPVVFRTPREPRLGDSPLHHPHASHQPLAPPLLHSNRRRLLSRQMPVMMSAAASPLAKKVVVPKFQSVMHASQLASLLARKNPKSFSSSMALQAVANAEKVTPQIGLTYFPPMNCNPTIIAPEPAKKLKFSAPAGGLPEYFNWGDVDNIAVTKNWGRRPAKLGSYITPPPNQLACGSCWAVASAGVFSDRWAIFTQGINPYLSATDILGCVSDGSSVRGADVNFSNIDGCNGGIPAGAAELMAKYGIVNSSCSSYKWCEQNGVCNGRSSGSGTSINSSVLPACSTVKTCQGNSGVKPTVFKAKRYGASNVKYSLNNPNIPKVEKKTSKGISFSAPIINSATSAAVSLVNITDIKDELWLNGPVVGAMAVFADFQAGSNKAMGGDDWAPTNNVYCNVQGPNRPYSKTRYANVETELTGYHAISIIGWGVEKNVPDWQHPGQTINIPYWIVRNSWSNAWNKNCTVNNGKYKMPGFVKIAFTDTTRGINTQVYLDRSDGGALGGATAFEPDVSPRASPPPLTGAPQPQPQPLLIEAGGYDCVANKCVASKSMYANMDKCSAACGAKASRLNHGFHRQVVSPFSYDDGTAAPVIDGTVDKAKTPTIFRITSNNAHIPYVVGGSIVLLILLILVVVFVVSTRE